MKLSTFNPLLVVRVERSGGFLEDLPKIGFKTETMLTMISERCCKTETLKKKILNLETSIDILTASF